MRRLAAVALVVVGLAVPVYAQRAASHSGAQSHASPAFHGGGFHVSGPRGFSGGFGGSAPRGSVHPGFNRQTAPRYSAGRAPFIMARGSHGGNGGRLGDRSGDRDRDHGRGHRRRPYISPYGFGYPYPGYGAFGWIDPYPLDDLGDSDDTDASSSDAASENPGSEGSDQGYGAPPEQPWQPPQSETPWQPPTRGPYRPSGNLSIPAAAPSNEEAVTLIFKDGRPAEQIHNYVLTRTTLFVGDQQRREIPTDQIDLAATAKANRDAGIDFSLPGAGISQ